MTDTELLEAILAELVSANASLERIAVAAVAVEHVLHVAAGFAFFVWVLSVAYWKHAFDSRL